jgi:hypothetical protein
VTSPSCLWLGRQSLPSAGSGFFVQIDSSTAASQLPSEFPAWDWRGLTGPCLPDPAARLESCQTPYAQQCILPSSDKAGSKSKTLGAD